MNNAEKLQEIEITIAESKKAIELMESLQRLTNNADFKKVMLDGYFGEECIRLVLLKGDYEMRDEDQQSQILKSIDAIGHTRAYFRTIMQVGTQVSRDLGPDEATQEELLAEQL